MSSTAFRIKNLKNILGGVKLSQNLTSAKSYQHTISDGKLSPLERDFYERNGYILVRNLIPQDIIDVCMDHFKDICDGEVDEGLLTLMKEILHENGEFVCNKIQHIHYDVVFSKYTEYPRLLNYVECFTGQYITGLHSLLTNKPPRAPIHPPHQDLHFLPLSLPDRIVACWTAMDPVSINEGCLYVIPGSHKGHLYPHECPPPKAGLTVNKGYHYISNHVEVAPEMKRVYLPMEKGDTVFFHPLLVHGSGPNCTDKFSKAMSCHYGSNECEYNTEADGPIQEIIGENGEVLYTDMIFLKFIKDDDEICNPRNF